MKYALITGATSGIGASYSRKLAEKGYNLIITGRRKEVINRVAQEIRDKHNIDVKVIIADFSKELDVEKLIEEIKTIKIEFLVNNVGFGHKEKFLEDTYEQQKKMIDVHIGAMCRITHHIAKKMKINKKGYIVNVSSMASFTPTSFNHLYSASKAFINTFSEALYIDLIDVGVKVQSLCPGFTKTDFHRKLEIDKKTYKNRGLVRWMNPEKVVEISLKEIEVKGGICIPGICNKIIFFLIKRTPSKIYYKVVKELKM